MTRGNEAGTDVAKRAESASEPATGHRAALVGPFSGAQLTRLSDALAAADAETGLHFSVYVGPLATDDALPAGADEPPKASSESLDAPPPTLAARHLHAQLLNPADAVLLAVSPNQRVVEIVTGERSRKVLSDRTCALVSLSAVSAFAGGDLVGGIVTALRMLTDRARS